MKLAMAVFAADLLARRADRTADPKMVLVPVLAVLGISSVLILKQPTWDRPRPVLHRIRHPLHGRRAHGPIVKVLLGFGALAVVVGLADPYRRDRILSFLNPGANKSGSGYQVWQSLDRPGVGTSVRPRTGRGRQKWGLLPTPTPTSSSPWWAKSSG